MQTIPGFDLEEIEQLADFGIEGTLKQDSQHLLPSQLSNKKYAISKANETINFILMLDVAKTLSIESAAKKKAAVVSNKTTPVEETKIASAVQISSYVLKERQKAQEEYELKANDKSKILEKELFEYIAVKLNEKKISVQNLFTEIDIDQSGEITEKEFDIFMTKLGYTLSPNEVKILVKAIDSNSDGNVSYRELREKLLAYGYEEPWKMDIYTHEWEDHSVLEFFKKFNQQNQFYNYIELFKNFDYNKDGTLSLVEIKNAFSFIDKFVAERMMNAVLVVSKYDLSVESIVKALEILEKAIPRKIAKLPSTEAFEESIKKFNSLEQLKSIVDEFGHLALSLYKQAVKGRKKRGIELYSGVYRVNEGLGLMRSAVIRYQAFMDHLTSFALERILREANLYLIKPDYNVQPNIIQGFNQILIPKKGTNEFKLSHESLYVMNFAIKQYLGCLLPDQTDVKVVMYGPEGLRHVSSDGNSLDFHLSKELDFHMILQDRCPHLLKCHGIHEKRVGKDPSDKEIYVIYERLKGKEISDFIEQNGGLLKIPIIYNTRASIYLAKFWGKQLLNLIYTVQSHSFALRNLNLSSFLLSENAEIKLTNLQGIGRIDANGKIISAPDITLSCHQSAENEYADLLNNSFIAPEFILSRDQTTAVDV